MVKNTEGTEKVKKFGGLDIEKKISRWLEDRGFKVQSYGKKHSGCWDIKASKGKDKWIIEVKGGYTKYKPPVNIEKIIKMTKQHGFNRIGLIFLPKNNIPMFFELNKMSYAGLKASKTKGKKKEQLAGEKAWRKRRKH